MKIVMSLESIPLKVEIEGSDDSMPMMVDVATETLIKMRKIWLDAIKRQTKIDEHAVNQT